MANPASASAVRIALARRVTVSVKSNGLKRAVEDMKKLLKRAKKYDEDNHEPDCEIDDKVELLRKVAKFVGVSLEDVLPAK